MSTDVYAAFVKDYEGPVLTVEVRPGVLFDTAIDGRLVAVQLLGCTTVEFEGDAQLHDGIQLGEFDEGQEDS